MWSRKLQQLATIAALLVPQAAAVLRAVENSTHYVLQNDRLLAAVAKATGGVTELTLDEQDLLGPIDGSRGMGPYLDCSCIPSGFWTPGGTAKYQLIKGVDSTGTPYGGVIMGDTYAATNQSLYQYWFLREGETGLHVFSRVTYFNEDVPLLRDLGELRTLFRPNTPLWTHLSSSDSNWAPLPSEEAFSKSEVVQDATDYLGNTPNDPYVQQYSDYWTKYSHSESWRDHDVHGQYSDGRHSSDGSTFGAWLVHNTRETYYGGPLKSDLVVDGIVYNYMVAGHYGVVMPNLTHGFDRTFGPQFYYFNKGGPDTSLSELRADAASYADPEWNAEFYDSIAEYVPNYVPSSGRTTFTAKIKLPAGAKRPIAVLSENGVDFQLNAFDHKALQYWGDIKNDGRIEIPRVKKGIYRLTVYADGIFGWFIQDDITISSSSPDLEFEWEAQTNGKEIWRIGKPDKSSGDFRHGYEPDTSKPLQPEQYRIYWAAWDFPTDFPNGVNFEVGKSKEEIDFNYVHWSAFGGKGNMYRPEPALDVNNWTITFDLDGADLDFASEAVFTVQLAGAKTANGNAKWTYKPEEKYSNLPWTVAVNSVYEDTWVIPYWRSGSCGVRSGVTCQNIEHQFTFPTELLNEGKNEFVLSLPFNATSTETAVLPNMVYVQYDALRLDLR
ncbi:hypothetical protein AJ80_09289 [Polytolypa hystricis UAMH7299]|uniref:Rhamnogalacturonan endolyase n=1 Tax=Polytolypa hystricis (strain UAMH7299) TaxID=1447883 RepID=A0A2B7WTA0_POLH7|nr:hypothetical protein AJ80_09289 [Polytolypa hystricis UAMH7299]